MSENPPEIQETVLPLRSLANIRAFSEVGFANLSARAVCYIEPLDPNKKWNVVARHHLEKLRTNGQLTFGDALEAMKAGYQVRRTSWDHDTERPITLKTGLFYRDVGHGRYSTFITALPSQDIAAENWQVLEKLPATPPMQKTAPDV